jgi:hypothetical protein
MVTCRVSKCYQVCCAVALRNCPLYYFSYLCTYNLYGPVRNVFDACRSLTWTSGRGLGPVKWHRADRRVPFGPQKTRTNCNVHKETLRYIKIDLNFTKVRNYFEKR